MGRYLNLAKNALKNKEYYQEEPFLPGEQAPHFTSTHYEITKKDELSPGGKAGTCLARIIGRDRVAQSENADPCWHCDSTGKCGCAECAVQDGKGQWVPGECRACKATGFLAWGSLAGEGGQGTIQ